MLKSRQTITPVTRRDVTDYISTQGINWAGRLDEVAFLQRMWPLDSMPSTDGRFRTAAGDIRQHRINNPQDWPEDWVFSDERFALSGGSDEQFIEFLCQMLHPVVRPNAEEVEELLAFFNECLEKDDWEIVEVNQISGRPVFEGRRREAIKTPTQALDLDEYERLDDPQVVSEHLRRIDRDLKNDPSGAIGSSKELVESVCKAILDDYGEPYGRDDLPDLYKKVAKVLRLNSEAVPTDRKGSKAAVKTLRALVTTIQSLAELRNTIGSGHGQTTRSPALSRHARLAFNSAVAVAEFLLDTWQVRRREE